MFLLMVSLNQLKGVVDARKEFKAHGILLDLWFAM